MMRRKKKGKQKLKRDTWQAESMQELHSNANTLLLQHYYMLLFSDSCTFAKHVRKGVRTGEARQCQRTRSHGSFL